MNKIYCIYCGKENNIKDKKCKNCKKNLKAHDFELLKFIGKEVKDDSKEKFIDYIFEFIKNLFVKHVYGIILSLSIVVAVGSTVLNLTNNNEGYNGKITNEKYSFNKMDDETMILGCWHNSGFIYGGEEANTYFKFDNVLTVATGNRFYHDYFSLSYFFYDDSQSKGVKYLGSENWDQDDFIGVFNWKDYDTFYLEALDDTYYFNRIDCNDMPNRDEWFS